MTCLNSVFWKWIVWNAWCTRRTRRVRLNAMCLQLLALSALFYRLCVCVVHQHCRIICSIWFVHGMILRLGTRCTHMRATWSLLSQNNEKQQIAFAYWVEETVELRYTAATMMNEFVHWYTCIQMLANYMYCQHIDSYIQCIRDRLEKEKLRRSSIDRMNDSHSFRKMCIIHTGIQ